MASQRTWIGISIGVFLAGIGIGYGIFASTASQAQFFGPHMMGDQSVRQQMVMSVMQDNQFMNEMMQDEDFQRQMVQQMRQDGQFRQNMMAGMMEDPALRQQMMGYCKRRKFSFHPA